MKGWVRLAVVVAFRLLFPRGFACFVGSSAVGNVFDLIISLGIGSLMQEGVRCARGP